VPPHDPTEVLVRPGAPLETSPVTKKDVKRFRRNPYLLRNKLFVDEDANTGAGMSSSGPHQGLLYMIVGLLFTDTSDIVMVRIEGSPVTDEVFINPLLKRIAKSKMVG
jgi:hypothetical protein